jgi:hypothetical protein
MLGESRRRGRGKRVLAAAILLLFAATPVLAADYFQLQEEEAKLEKQVGALQLEAFRARLAKDDQKAKDLGKKLEKLEKRRVEVLQGMGKLPE